jgi:hypothetical protein
MPDRIRIGGLFRCCIETAHAAPPASEGDLLACPHHADPEKPQMIFRDGAWEWVGPDA